MKFKDGVAIGAFAIATAGGMTALGLRNLDTVTKALQSQGYQEPITVHTELFFGENCAITDSFSATYKAADAAGKIKSGIVCGKFFGAPVITPDK